MKIREFFGVPATLLLGMACGSFPALAATSPAPARPVKAANPTSPQAAGAERELRLLGAHSGADENDDDEPDDVFVMPPLRPGLVRGTGPSATASGATAGGESRTESTKQGSGTGGGGSGPTPLSSLPKAAEMIEQVRQALKGTEVNVALLGSHKYMINDCLGIKVSAGTFKLRLADPKIYFQGTALIFECGINHIEFSAIKLRMRPNPNVLKLCKFSKKFEVGGEADDVRLKLTMDPLVDLAKCQFYSSVLPEGTVRIGNLNLKPLQNNLDTMAKNAVEDALTAFLHVNFFDQITRLFDDMIEADCPGADVRKGIESTIGGGGRGNGGGVTSGGGADVAGLAQRVQQLEARVAALEQQPLGAGDTAQASAGRSPSVKGGAASAKGRNPAVVTKAPPPASKIDGSLRVAGPSSQLRSSATYEIVANPDLKGRLGRIVVAFPAGAAAPKLSARTEFFKAGEGKGLRTEFGNAEVEMTPGAYDINIGGHKVGGVPVESRSDTIVKVGVLQLIGSDKTRFEIFEPAGKKGLQTLFGQNAIGLPIGTYEVEVNGQREPVTIQEGRVLEY